MRWHIFVLIRHNLMWRIATTDDPEQVRRYEAVGCVAREAH